MTRGVKLMKVLMMGAGGWLRGCQWCVMSALSASSCSAGLLIPATLWAERAKQQQRHAEGNELAGAHTGLTPLQDQPPHQAPATIALSDI
jgi:hypothetical protein